MQTNLDASPGERGTLDQPALLEDLTTAHLHTDTARLWGLSLFSLTTDKRIHTLEEALPLYYSLLYRPHSGPPALHRNTDELRLHVRGR